MNNKLSLIVKRYLMAAIIVVVGIAMIFVGLRTNQDALFMIAAINLLIGGALALLFSAGVLHRNIVLGVSVVCILITVYVGFMTRDSVADTMQHEKDYVRSERLYQYTLNQIRDIQRAYRTANGIYAPDFETLKQFYENDKIRKIDAEGAVPSRRLTIEERDALYTDKRALDHNMTEREAALLAAMGNPTDSPDLRRFKRDTIFVTYKEEFLASPTRKKAREDLGLGEFDIEELRYVPLSDPKEEWVFETREAVPYLNNDTIPTIYVYGREAVPRFEDGSRKIVGFGSLQTASDKGTWE